MLPLVLILMSTLVLILKWIDRLVFGAEVLLKALALLSALALLNALALLRALGLLFRLFDELLDSTDIIGFFSLKV